MPANHPRAQLATQLKTAVPKTWRVIPFQREIDVPNATTVIVKQSAIGKTPGSVRTVRFVLTVVSRFQDPERAEDDLDVTVPEFLAILDRIRNLTWTEATKVAVDEKHLGYDVEVTITTKKESL